MNMSAQPRPHCGEFFPSMPLSLTERDIEAWYFASSPIAQTKLHPQPAEVSDRPIGRIAAERAIADAALASETRRALRRFTDVANDDPF